MLIDKMLLRSLKGAARWFGAKGFNSPSNRILTIHLVSAMESCEYEKAVAALNGLQSNAAYIKKARAERSSKAYQNIIDTERHLQSLHISLKDVDSLNIIHVAGTKGKGSTCAFVESILRSHGYTTGFYSSPHLISVNERIRVNGNPLSKEKFTFYFWKVYDTVKHSLKEDEHMPSYFLFLTVMAFYVFVKERVKATVVEVGIGGLYDCTNVIRNPVAVGITTLGIDHVSLLGNTITEIAEQKAGIFKPNVPAFTVPQQENAMRVLREKAESVKCSLALSPPLESYENNVSLGVQGIVQNVNASLALQLSHCWLSSTKCENSKLLQTYPPNNENHFPSDESSVPLLMAETFPLNVKTQKALQNCTWPGRFQTVEKSKITFYLDGAHTYQSMKYCGKWFEELNQKHKSSNKSSALKVLLFNCTGERKAESLLDPLADIHFDVVLFCPNKISAVKDASSDLSNFMVEPEQELQQCITNKEIWCHLMRSLYENELSRASSYLNSPFSAPSNRLLECDNTIIFPSITDTLSWLNSCDTHNNFGYESNLKELTDMVRQASHMQVLVTGSLHLVGGVLSLIQS